MLAGHARSAMMSTQELKFPTLLHFASSRKLVFPAQKDGVKLPFPLSPWTRNQDTGAEPRGNWQEDKGKSLKIKKESCGSCRWGSCSPLFFCRMNSSATALVKTQSLKYLLSKSINEKPSLFCRLYRSSYSRTILAETSMRQER